MLLENVNSRFMKDLAITIIIYFTAMSNEITYPFSIGATFFWFFVQRVFRYMNVL